MRKPFPWLVLGAAAAIGLCAGRADAASEERSVVVLIDDRAGVRPIVLDQAEKQAARIYRQAGVNLVWRAVRKPDPLQEAPQESSERFAVRLIIQSKFRGTSGTGAPFLMGAAPETSVECGGTAYLFFDQVFGFASVMRLDEALVLGTVAAHEVGHVLLRRTGHSADGLMNASWKTDDWQRAASGLLLFSPAEREQVRRRITACR
jgi:hypothetical protein